MIVQFGQGIKSMNALTEELEKMVLEKKITHNGNKILQWNLDNIMIHQDSVRNIKIDKAKSTKKQIAQFHWLWDQIAQSAMLLIKLARMIHVRAIIYWRCQL